MAALEVFDKGSGPLVVLIHGVGSDGSIWAEDAAWIAEQHRFVTYNRRGFGASPPSPKDWKAHGDDAIELLESLDAGPAALCGYSGGATVALDVAVRRPELVRRLVLIDPVVHPRSFMTPEFAARFARIQLIRRVRGPQAGVEAWFRYATSHADGSPPTWERAPEARRKRLLATAEGVFADFASGDGRHVAEEQISAIDKPVRIIGAGLSPSFIRKSVARLGRLLPEARVETIDDAGHILAIDQPAAFRAAFERALTD